jgi:D-xylonolactonase
MDADVERVADTHCDTGEGPLWHPDEGALYWVDIPNGCLFRYWPDEDDHELVFAEHTAQAGFTIEEDGSLALFRARGLVEGYDGGDRETLVNEIDRERPTRFNDAIADPEGRAFAGTMPTADGPGNLYRFDPDGDYERVVPDVDIPNGMGFTEDLETFYFTESEEHVIYEYDYDRATGEISNQRTFVDTSGEAGVPDGMTVDEEGYVWSARWNGGCVVRYDPDGNEVGRVDIPAQKVSSVTFGGPDYGTAYVTTALEGHDRAEEGEGAGALFAIDAPVSGRPEFRSSLW